MFADSQRGTPSEDDKCVTHMFSHIRARYFLRSPRDSYDMLLIKSLLSHLYNRKSGRHDYA